MRHRQLDVTRLRIIRAPRSSHLGRPRLHAREIVRSTPALPFGIRIDDVERAADDPTSAREMAESGDGAMLAVFERPADLTPRDWAVFLLHSAAEVEHALLVQYLYAAYSLKDDESDPNDPAITTAEWQAVFTRIAAEEMGHLLTVQNLLRFIGGPLNFEREDFPVRTGLYPFPFNLEKLTKDSLAKYLFAEMSEGAIPPESIDPPFTEAERREIEDRARKAVGAGDADMPFVNHVGTLYTTLIRLFADAGSLKDSDFRPESVAWQQKARRTATGESDPTSPWSKTNETTDLVGIKLMRASDREQAVTALEIIATQGEAADPVQPGESHFERFLRVYRAFPAPATDGEGARWEPAKPVATNPSTEPADSRRTFIANEHTRLWARLCNVRYRILLATLSHLTGLVPKGSDEIPVVPVLGRWIYQEMVQSSSSLRHLAIFLSSMPVDDAPAAAGQQAGMPFELPYTLMLPELPRDRWRVHRDLIDASAQLIAAISGVRVEELATISLSDPRLPELLGNMLERDGRTEAEGRRKNIADHMDGGF